MGAAWARDRWWGALERRGDGLDVEGTDDVALADLREPVDHDAALEAFLDFLDVVLEHAERADGAIEQVSEDHSLVAERIRAGELDPDSVEVRMLSNILTRALGMDRVNRLFANDNPLLRGLRDLGMGLISATPALRRGFMRQAAGLSGDLPRLLKGKPI